jgi:acetolactate synthase I/III small subunit
MSTTTIVAAVENKTGVLARVAGLFSARGLNIESLSVAPTQDPTLSQLTIVLAEPEAIVEQVLKLLHRVIEVVKVANITRLPHIERELALIVVDLPPSAERCELLDRARRLGAAVIDAHHHNIVLEIAGDREKIEEAIGLFDRQSIRELVRTGSVVLPRTHWTKKRESSPLRAVERATPAEAAEELAGEPPA